MANIYKNHIYQIFRGGVFKGVLQNVISPFTYPQDINSVGAPLNIVVAQSADVAGLTGTYTDVVGNNNANALIRNGNVVKVFEVSSTYPNGKAMYSGEIIDWEGDFGGDGGSDRIVINCFSDGADFNNFMIQTGTTYTSRQSNTSTNGDTPDIGGSNSLGESLIPGVNFNFAKIVVPMRIGQSLNGTGVTSVDVTMSLRSYDGGNPFAGTSTILGSVTVTITSYTYSDITFALPTIAAVTTSGKYGVVWTAPINFGFQIKKQSPGGGTTYAVQGGAGAADGSWAGSSYDLVHNIYSVTTNSTTSAYSAQDPTAIFKSVVDDYHGQGGIVNYSASSTDNTGLSIPYTFTSNTSMEGVSAIQNIAPHDWYHYVDVATSIIYFKQTLTTATYTFIKGRHVSALRVKASIANVKNKVYVTGGLVAGANLFYTYTDSTSITAFGQKLARVTDNHVIAQAGMDAIGNSFIAENKNESYQTPVDILDSTMDITLPQVGETVAFEGYGALLDGIVFQIVRKTYNPEKLSLFLGTLPPRLNLELEQAKRDILALQTINNPSSAS